MYILTGKVLAVRIGNKRYYKQGRKLATIKNISFNKVGLLFLFCGVIS